MNNPVKYIDPDGRDWYEPEGGGKGVWQEGNAPTINIDGTTYNNVGENYCYTEGLATHCWEQNNLVSSEYTTEGSFHPQLSNTKDCKKMSDLMVYSTGGNPSNGTAGQIMMANRDANGRAATPTDNVEAGIDRINAVLMQGIGITVGVDYKNGHPGNADKMTDHFIAVVGMRQDFKSGTTSYNFYDPGSATSGGNYSANTMSLLDGFLQGKTANGGRDFKVTTVRNSTRRR
jgi:hypothetical protein